MNLISQNCHLSSVIPKSTRQDKPALSSQRRKVILEG